MNQRWVGLGVAFALFAGAAGAQYTKDPKDSSAVSESATTSKPLAGKPPAKAEKKLVNLNAASAKELKALPGGSDEEAARIIAGRPYSSKAFLVTNNIISAGRYEEIRKLVVAGPSRSPL